MELMLLRVFQRQVALQCEAVIFADEDLRRALRSGETSRAWVAIQNLLGAGANVSKALWGPGGKLATERESLRASLEIDDMSPFRETGMRNNFEHLDSRLDEWWEKSPNHLYIDMNFGDVRAAISATDEIDTFRNFDPATFDVIFWGQQHNIQGIVSEAERVLPIAVSEAMKPNWEPPESAPPG